MHNRSDITGSASRPGWRQRAPTGVVGWQLTRRTVFPGGLCLPHLEDLGSLASAGRAHAVQGPGAPGQSARLPGQLGAGVPSPTSLKPEPQGERGSRLDLCCLWVSLSSSLSSKTALQQRQLRTWTLAIHCCQGPLSLSPGSGPGAGVETARMGSIFPAAQAWSQSLFAGAADTLPGP